MDLSIIVRCVVAVVAVVGKSILEGLGEDE